MNQKGLPLRSFLAEGGQSQVLILAGIVLAIALAGGIFYLGRISAPKPQNVATSSPQPSPTLSPTTTPADETTSWKTYTNTKYGYSFKYPFSGNIQDMADDTNVVYLNNDSNEPYYLFNLQIIDNPQNLTPRQVIDNELTALRKSNSPGSSSLADKRQATIKNYQNGEVSGLYIRGGSDGDSITDFIKVVVSHKDNIYEFTIHDGNGSVDEFQKKLMDQILSTFKFTQ